MRALRRSVSSMRQSCGLADRRLQVGDAIVVADPLVPVGAVGRHAVIAQQPQRGRKLLRIGEAHAAFARGDDLVGVEGEAGDVAELPDRPAGVARAVRFRAVLDHGDAAASGELGDRADLRRPAVEMDGNDRLGLRRAGVLDRIAVMHQVSRSTSTITGVAPQ